VVDSNNVSIYTSNILTIGKIGANLNLIGYDISVFSNNIISIYADSNIYGNLIISNDLIILGNINLGRLVVNSILSKGNINGEGNLIIKDNSYLEGNIINISKVQSDSNVQIKFLGIHSGRIEFDPKTELFNINQDNIEQIETFNNYIESVFIISKINELNFNNYHECDDSFYNNNIYKDIDEIQEEINSKTNFMEYLIKELEVYIEEKNHFKKNNEDKSLIKLVNNDRDGHYLLITNRRCEILKNNLIKNNIKKINIGIIELDIKDLIYEPQPKPSNTKISCQKIKDFSKDLVLCKQNLCKKIKKWDHYVLDTLEIA
jgi:hypothetical protein